MRKTIAALTLLLVPVAFAQTAPATAPATTAPATTAPVKAPIAAPAGKTAPMTMPATNAAKINVNTASAADLAKIPGVNPKIAADIIKNRPYKNSAELVKKVKGIGPKNVKKMLPFILF